MLFQMMFAVITPALITGAFAERKKFSTFIVFILAWATLVYDPLAHWVWGVGGWLRNLGALDFAGRHRGAHLLRASRRWPPRIVIGKRRGFGHQPMPPHNLPLTVMGAGLLWFGWFGFNAGSALGANGLAAHAFMTTNTAAAAAVLGWMFTEWASRGKPTVLGAASGAVAGPRGHHPGGGVRDADGLDRDRRGGGRHLLHARATSRRSSATTTRSTWWAFTGWAAPGARWPPGSSPPRP